LADFTLVAGVPPWGAGWALGLGVAAGIAAVVAYWREQRRAGGVRLSLGLLALRLSAIAVLVWMLLGPVRSRPAKDQQVPRPLGVRVDRSASMEQRDVTIDGQRVSRREAADAWLARAPLPAGTVRRGFDSSMRAWDSDAAPG